MAEANKKAKSANGFFQRMLGSTNVVNDDARELYIQAGNAAKGEGDYPTSVEAYQKALDLSSEDYERAQMYEAISSSYKMFDLSQAVAPLTRAAELYMAQGKWTTASQILEKVAELYEQMNDFDNMIKSLKEALRFAKQEGQKAAANRIQKRMAETFVLQHRFIEAQQEYEEMAEKSKDDAMLKYNAKDFWFRWEDRRNISIWILFIDETFRAALCALCIDVENANTALNRYISDNPLFEERSLEVKLLRQLIAAIEEQNKELFLKHFDETALTPVRSDRMVRSMIDEIGKKMNGDVDLK